MAKRQMQIRATQTGQVSKKAQGEPCFLESSWDDNAVEQTCQKAVASCLDLRLVTGHCYGLVQGREGEGNRCVDQCTGMGEFYSRAHLRLVAGCTCVYACTTWLALVGPAVLGRASLPPGTTTRRHHLPALPPFPDASTLHIYTSHCKQVLVLGLSSRPVSGTTLSCVHGLSQQPTQERAV